MATVQKMKSGGTTTFGEFAMKYFTRKARVTEQMQQGKPEQVHWELAKQDQHV